MEKGKKKNQIQQVNKIHTADPNQDDRQGKQHPILLTFQANQQKVGNSYMGGKPSIHFPLTGYIPSSFILLCSYLRAKQSASILLFFFLCS